MMQPYISNHAVERFRERILHEHARLTDAEIREILTETMLNSPIEGVLTWDPYTEHKYWKYHYEGRWGSKIFFIATRQVGGRAITVHSEIQHGEWTIFGYSIRVRRDRNVKRAGYTLCYRWVCSERPFSELQKGRILNDAKTRKRPRVA